MIIKIFDNVHSSKIIGKPAVQSRDIVIHPLEFATITCQQILMKRARDRAELILNNSLLSRLRKHEMKASVHFLKKISISALIACPFLRDYNDIHNFSRLTDYFQCRNNIRSILLWPRGSFTSTSSSLALWSISNTFSNFSTILMVNCGNKPNSSYS